MSSLENKILNSSPENECQEPYDQLIWEIKKEGGDKFIKTLERIIEVA